MYHNIHYCIYHYIYFSIYIINTGVCRGIAPRPITPALWGLYTLTRSTHITKSMDVLSIYYYTKHINKT